MKETAWKAPYCKYEKLKSDMGVTDYLVANKTGIAQSSLSDWKNGKYEPKIDKLIKIAQFFNVPLERLLKETVVAQEKGAET